MARDGLGRSSSPLALTPASAMSRHNSFFVPAPHELASLSRNDKRLPVAGQRQALNFRSFRLRNQSARERLSRQGSRGVLTASLPINRRIREARRSAAQSGRQNAVVVKGGRDER